MPACVITYIIDHEPDKAQLCTLERAYLCTHMHKYWVETDKDRDAGAVPQ